MEAMRRAAGHQQTLTVVAALGALFGLVYVAGGPGTTDAPVGLNAHLYQEAPGDQALIRVNVPDRRTVPLPEQTYAWLFYRSDGQRNFSAHSNNLVGVSFEASLPNQAWDDHPGFETVEVEREFTYITGDGDEEEVSIELLFHHFPLEPGHTYFYRVQRVVEPLRRAGAGAPIAVAGVGPRQIPEELDDIEFDVDPPEAMSEPSRPTDGVTYITPPVLQTPEAGAADQRTHEITFTWSATVGANEYILQVFPADDPDGRRVPRHQVEMRQDRAGILSHTVRATFAANTNFYWRVGARRAGEPLPMNKLLRGTPHERGWLFSNMRSFRTARTPPPVPSSAVGGEGGQVQPGSMGIGRYQHRAPGQNSSGVR